MGPSVRKIFRDDFFTRMGPSVRKIFRDDFSREWDHLCARYLEMIFSRQWDHLCPRYLEIIFSRQWDHLCPRYLDRIFSRQWDHLCPRYLEMIFSRQWDHLCPTYLEMIFSRQWDHLYPRYLGVMFHPSGTICAQNVRFYIEATLSVHGEIIFPVCFFSRVSSIACFSLYIFSFDLFFFACLAVFTQVGRSVPKIFRDDFSREWDHLCPRYLGVIFYPSRSISVGDI